MKKSNKTFFRFASNFSNLSLWKLLSYSLQRNKMRATVVLKLKSSLLSHKALTVKQTWRFNIFSTIKPLINLFAQSKFVPTPHQFFRVISSFITLLGTWKREVLQNTSRYPMTNISSSSRKLRKKYYRSIIFSQHSNY